MIDALADAARAIERLARGARRDPLRRGQGVLRRRRHRRLGRPAAARDVARLDARRPSRLRGAGAAARAADRRADRPRVRRRPRTRGGRRHPHRRDAASSSACRRRGLGMAPGWSGTQRLVRRFGASVVRRMALDRAHVHSARRRCRSASSTRSPRRARRSPAPRRWPPTSRSAARSRCRSSRR